MMWTILTQVLDDCEMPYTQFLYQKEITLQQNSITKGR